MGIIYKTTNLINNKIYIGQDSHNNPKYLGSGLNIIKSIKKYGKENFIKVTLEECINESLNEREIHWIALLDSTNPTIGYNLTSGGRQLTEYTAEVRQKMSDNRKGITAWNKGKTVSEDTLFKMRESKKVISVESRKKMSDARLGRKAWNSGGSMLPMSQATKDKISKSKKI